jgi:hypothetical protein
MVFFDKRINSELVPKFHVAQYASHAALLTLSTKFRYNHHFHVDIRILFKLGEHSIQLLSLTVSTPDSIPVPTALPLSISNALPFLQESG